MQANTPEEHKVVQECMESYAKAQEDGTFNAIITVRTYIAHKSYLA